MSNIHFDDTYSEKQYLNAIQSDFTVRAPSYNSGKSGRQHRETIQTLLRECPPQYPLLDIACGTGLLAEQLGRKGEGVTGLDLTHAMLEQARVVNPRATFVQGRAESMPFDDCSFACAYCCSALVYFTDIPAVVREAYRVVRPGGFFAYQAVTLDSYVLGIELERALRQVLGRKRADDIFKLPHGITQDAQANRELMTGGGFVKVEATKYVINDTIEVSDIERSWRAIVGRNALMGKLRTLPEHQMLRIRETWVQLLEERRNVEGVVPEVIGSWYVCGWKP